MLYPFMTLDDGTEIVHSEAINDNNKEKVKVVIEKPVCDQKESQYFFLVSSKTHGSTAAKENTVL